MTYDTSSSSLSLPHAFGRPERATVYRFVMSINGRRISFDLWSAFRVMLCTVDGLMPSSWPAASRVIICFQYSSTARALLQRSCSLRPDLDTRHLSSARAVPLVLRRFLAIINDGAINCIFIISISRRFRYVGVLGAIGCVYKT